jgi:acyl-CoA synthetase (AMP-forming)/AMP-acid ligase II
MLGAVVVMANPALREEDVAHLARLLARQGGGDALDTAPARQAAARTATPDRRPSWSRASPALERVLAEAPAEGEIFASHPDDPAIWLFSGGIHWAPQAVVQTHRSFANTTACARTA